MGSELLPLFLILVVGISVYWIISTLFAGNADAAALSWASGNEPTKSKNKIIEFSRPLVHQFTIKYAQKVKRETYRKGLEYKIIRSGLSTELNVDEFIGLQILWGILFPALMIILNFALQLGYPTILLLLLSPFGFYIPHMHANAEIKRRTGSVLIDLPFFIDLLALSTEAGLDFIGAIQRIVDKARGGKSVLADELETVLRDIALGSSRAQALKGLSYRLDVPEVTSFVNVVVDADATGASIAKVLKDQSMQMRLERFVRAEKAGAKASQAMLIPLMVFILPAVFIMVFAPVALQFFYGKK